MKHITNLIGGRSVTSCFCIDFVRISLVESGPERCMTAPDPCYYPHKKKNRHGVPAYRLELFTSRMTAQGAGKASNFIRVPKHVIGLAWYRIWYALAYSSRRPDRGHSSWIGMARKFFFLISWRHWQVSMKTIQCTSVKYLPTSLEAFDFPEGSSRNWSVTSVWVHVGFYGQYNVFLSAHAEASL